MIYILFGLGLFFLLKGADLLVAGSSVIARRFNLSEMVIGLTIVSFGTSMPELIVNVYASITDRPEIAIGNVLGSNIANILLILGITALVRALPVHRETVLFEVPFSLAAAFLLGFVANAALFDLGESTLMLSRPEAGMLLVFFLLFMLYIFRSSQDAPEPPEDGETPEMSLTKAIVYVLLGIAGLFVGGKWVVDGAVEMARHLGMSEAVIGLTVVGVGTSLPELLTSVMAAYREKTDIAVGNVVGSNIFNLLWILGVSGVIRPLPFFEAANLDLLVLVGSSAALLFALVGRKRNTIGRGSGLFFVLAYIAYLIWLLWRG